MNIHPRLVFAALFAICVTFVLTAIFYFQQHLGLEPCPMCILSRYTFIAIALVALVAAIHGPRGGVALKVYAGLAAVLALVGVGISVRHSYLQRNPPKIESCGADLEFMLNTMPWSQAFPRIFSGTGSCSKVDWSLMGLSIPEWAGIWYAVFAGVLLWTAFRRPRAA